MVRGETHSNSTPAIALPNTLLELCYLACATTPKSTDQIQRIERSWKERHDELVAMPFDVLTPIGGKNNFDPRGAWTALDAGYSPNDAKTWCFSLARCPSTRSLRLGACQTGGDRHSARTVLRLGWHAAAMLAVWRCRVALHPLPVKVSLRACPFWQEQNSHFPNRRAPYEYHQKALQSH